MTRDEALYIAGFLDGEGTITAACRRRAPSSGRTGGMYVLTVAIYNVHAGVMGYLHDLLGGSLIKTHRERYRPLWRWQIQQGRARDILRELQPHLRVKHEQARLAIQLWGLVDAYRHEIEHVCNLGRKLPGEEMARRDAIIARISELNRRGVFDDRDAAMTGYDAGDIYSPDGRMIG